MSGKLMNIYVYPKYERFWHWLQAALIILLLLTGFEINGSFSLFGFEKAVKVHNFAGITWLIAAALFGFWVFATGEWKQYLPVVQKMFAVMRYYVYGIFRGESHPVSGEREIRCNPLLRLIYLSLAALLLPIQMLSGFLYWGYNFWAEWGISGISLGAAAFVHTACAFAILSFLVVHVYMITTGNTLKTYIHAMITGWEEEGEIMQIAEGEKKSV